MPADKVTRLLLVDGHAMIHRAFHALPELSTSSGELVNAVFGFSSMLLKAIETESPSHIIMAMDRPTPTFRHQAYADYKAQRPPTPRQLTSQFDRVRQVASAMHIPIVELDGYEADDVLGTLAAQAAEQGIDTVVLTGDLDALQLVADRVHVLTPRRGMVETKLYDIEAVNERYGLSPYQIPDLKALVGDQSDNIPGVKGIGDKTASRLLQQFTSVEDLYAHLEDVPERQRIALADVQDQVMQSKELATIVRDAPVSLSLSEGAFDDVDRAGLIRLFGQLEFRSLIPRVQNLLGQPERQVTPQGQGGPEQLAMFDVLATTRLPDVRRIEDDSRLYVSAGSDNGGRAAAQPTVTRVVDDLEALQDLADELSRAERLALDTETTSTDALQANLVGLSFSTKPGHAWYVPVGHAEGPQLELEQVLRALAPALESEHSQKVAHNLKYDLTVLREHGLELRGNAFDTMVAAYLVNPTSRALSLSALALSRLDIEMTPIEALIGKGKAQVTMDRVPIQAVAAYAGEDADATLRLMAILEKDLQDRDLEPLFRDVEMPLVGVLADIERVGIALDPESLAEMSRDMGDSIASLESRIYETAGHPFNINSTQQLGHVLFEQLKLPSGRRTKSGHSTDIEVLEGLRGRHPIVDDILEYRSLIKLKNTYVDALPQLVNPRTRRLHTDFNQTVASTGRLSSSSPNLQNIPVRGELGRRIRRSFIATRPKNLLLAADYSQIELRILASMSGDEKLLDAFRKGEDVHRATASNVFRVPLADVTADQRRIAKVVNFGIIYGIGEGRLAYETGISREEAANFIANYNETYSGVKAFMDGIRRSAVEEGYVSTLLGRRRYVPDIHSNNPGIRQAAERAAINMPIQGTAADIIKIAMVRLHRALAEQYPASHMVLQVHDELVLDVPESNLDEVGAIVQRIMATSLDLQVPLEVEMKSGRDWFDMVPLEVGAVAAERAVDGSAQSAVPDVHVV